MEVVTALAESTTSNLSNRPAGIRPFSRFAALPRCVNIASEFVGKCKLNQRQSRHSRESGSPVWRTMVVGLWIASPAASWVPACAGMTGGLGVLRFPMSSVGAVAAPGALSLCGGRSSMVQRKQRLHRSRDDRLLFGVAGGLAEFLDVDPVLVRVGWILLTLATVGVAVLAYIVLAVITPNGRQPVSREVGKVNDSSSDISDSVVEPGPG